MDPVGHFSVALAASALAAPKAPVWVLGLATAVPDLLFFGFEALGWEHKAKTSLSLKEGLKYQKPATMYLSHGLFMTLLWSALATAIAWPFYRDVQTSILMGLMVFSHWLLDAIVYNNMPLFFKLHRASTRATYPPVMLAVLVPPSAWMTSQSTQSVLSPIISRFKIALSALPINL